MNVFITLLRVVLCTGLLYSCKKSELDLQVVPYEKRIKTITEYNWDNEAQSKIKFNYANKQVLSWQYYTKNEPEVWLEIKRIDIEYNNNTITTTLQRKQANSWITKQVCTFLVINNQVHEKTLSRTVFPVCENCWKYYYKYAGTQMLEWEKHIKTENNNWEVSQKMEYTYSNQKLISRNDYTNSDHSGLKLDYIRNYFYTNNQLSGWLSGIYIDDKHWKATHKVEYTYINDKIISCNFSAWNSNLEEWHLLSFVNYNYNDGYLMEENTSEGNKTLYEYEPGSGNTSILFYDPDCFIQSQPMLKSAIENNVAFKQH